MKYKAILIIDTLHRWYIPGISFIASTNSTSLSFAVSILRISTLLYFEKINSNNNDCV
jgi:hypothetical protein